MLKILKICFVFYKNIITLTPIKPVYWYNWKRSAGYTNKKKENPLYKNNNIGIEKGVLF